MRNSRRYTCIIRHGGGFGGGYGGTYEREHSYYSTHRAGSKANEEDATTTWHAQAARLYRLVRGRAWDCENQRGGLAMETREPKQWAEILKILKEAREDLEKAIEAERPIAERITCRR